ncbi:MAG: PAS domain S-box protein [Rhodopseudomonas sp.]|uniref:PAS domain S-box protein n=1 Tax=Rhodopseudomonas sp. TaxID=1078 RepID=UPI0039E4DB25
MSLVVSTAVMVWSKRWNDDIARSKFDDAAQRLVGQLEKRLATFQYGLRGVRGAVMAAGGERVTLEQYRIYTQTRDIETEFVGARGFGFIRLVQPGDIDAFVARAREEGRPNFNIRQFTPHQGPRYVIDYVEPIERNREAVGLDIASEANRKSAADVAAADGKATITAPITLVQTAGKTRYGFLILLPVYRAGASIQTEQERLEALIGWSYTVINIDDILAGADTQNGEFGYSLSDSGDRPFYWIGQLPERASSLPARSIAIPMYGRTWRLELWALPSFERSLNLTRPLTTFSITFTIGLLLTALIALLLFSRARRREQRTEQARLAAIVEGSNQAIVAKTVDGIVINWNKAAERLFGYTAEQAIGKKASELIVPEQYRQQEREMLAGVRDGRTILYLRTMRKKKSGELVDVAVSVSPIRSERGALIGIATAARDITDLVNAENEIRVLNASLERQVAERTAQLKKTMTLQTAILERAAYSVIATDPDGKISLFNPAAERLLGYKASELIGRETPALFHDPEEIAVRAEELRREGINPKPGLGAVRARLSCEDPYTSVWTYIARDGRRIPTQLTLSRLLSEDGSDLGILGIAVDLTDQLKYEDELKAARTSAEKASAAKADFLANMSHEIRTPLNGIIGYADLVLEDEALAPTTRRQVERIFQASDSLRVIIDDILDFSKIEAMGVQLESKPLYVHELIDNCMSITQPRAEEKGLELRVDALDVPQILMGDSARLRQVLLNLLNNAVKFTAAGSVDLVFACLFRAEDRARLRIAVTDTGIGISAQDQKGLFKRFSQADETISRKFGGTGLGLVISQRIVQAMGGEMKIDSKPGRGSTFHFEIELPIAAEIDIEKSEAPVDVGRPLKILVVDDVEMNRDLCKTMLTRAGHDVDLAESGAMAITMTAGGRCYDLILMDIQMGEIDGMEASRRIRALKSGCNNVPIVALTANVLPEQVKRYRAAGMDGHIGKPINRAELLAAVARWGDAGARERPSDPQPAAAAPAVVRDPSVLEELRMFASDEDIAGFTGQLREAIDSIPPRWPPELGITGEGEDPREALGRLAHKTVSLAGQLGFSRLAEACRRMEQACLEDVSVPEAFDALHRAIGEAVPEIAALNEAA